MTRRGWVIVCAAFGLVGCGGEDTPDVSPSAKTQIDRLAAEHDCVGLQGWFDATKDSAAGQLRYVDDKMRDAGCYDD